MKFRSSSEIGGKFRNRNEPRNASFGLFVGFWFVVVVSGFWFDFSFVCLVLVLFVWFLGLLDRHTQKPAE